MGKITKTDGQVVHDIIEAANFYRPTLDQRRVKAEFHTALAEGPSPKKVTAAFAVQITDRSVIEKWWKIPGFCSWFTEANSFENQAEAYANAALGVVMEAMLTADRPADQLAAAKLLIEIAGKVKKNRVETRFLDESIPDDLDQLNEYIEKAGGGKA